MGDAPLSRGSEFLRNTVLYYTGIHLDTLPASHLDSIDAAIAAGVNVLMTGQNVIQHNASHPLFAQTIGIGYGGLSTVVAHTGIAGGPFAGLTIFTTGNGAGNQTSRDILTPISPDAIPVLTYGPATGLISGVRREFSGTGSRVLVVGFGFEAIHSPTMRANVIGRAIGYLDGTLVGVEDPLSGGPGGVPSAYALHQNYPNPFNPATTIAYDLPVRSDVRLTATDILGREVLIDHGVREAGPVQLTWNAGTASGVYILRLTATPVGAGPERSFSAVRKMLVVR
jgi:hypothetical protein